MSRYADQIGINWLTMLGVGGMNKPRPAPADQARLLHHTLHSLVIDLPALSLKSLRHPTIAIASTVLPQLLQRQTKGSITVIFDARTAMLVIPLPIDVE